MDTIAKKAELEAALPILEKDLDGLNDWNSASISDDLRTKVQTQIAKHEQRRVLINRELNALDALEVIDAALVADGYPNLADIPLTPEEFAEMQEELSNIQTASETFSLDESAHSARISFGAPVPKT